MLGKIWTWFLFFIRNFIFLFLWELSETFVFKKKKKFERGFVRENLNMVFIFYPKLFIFIFMGVIRNFCYRIKSGLKKNKQKKLKLAIFFFFLRNIWMWVLRNFCFTFLTLSFKFYKLINLRVFWVSKLRNPNRGKPLK